MKDDYLPLYQKGASLCLDGQYEQAIAVLSESFRAHPNPESLRTIGECYMALGQVSDAVLYLAASIGLRSNPRASYLLADALVKCEAQAEALRAVQTAVDALPHYQRAIKLRDELRAVVHPYSWPSERDQEKEKDKGDGSQ